MNKPTYYERNKERILKRMKDDRKANPEKYRQYKKNHMKTDSYKINHRKHNKKYKQNNP